jgi:hypothetical protein
MMHKHFEDNEDWIKREKGRIPTKGAQAAERASAGLGTSEDDGALTYVPSPRVNVWAKPIAKGPRPGKQA